MSTPITPFKVGATYKDGWGSAVEIIHIRTDDCKYPIVGIRRREDIDPDVQVYCLDGVFDTSMKNTKGNLIPPAKPKKRVPLGPEDVPPGSVVRFGEQPGWIDLSFVSQHGIGFTRPTVGAQTWLFGECLASSMQIKVPGGNWQPMWKEIDDAGGSEG